MEEKKELNKILLGDENNHQSSKTKKMILMIIIAIVVILILLIIFWKMTREEPKEQSMTTDTSIEKMDALHSNEALDNNDDFENMSIDDMSKTEEENKFDKIVQDIKSKQLANNQEASQNNTDQAKVQPKEEKPLVSQNVQSNAPEQKPQAKETLKETKKVTKETKQPLASKAHEDKKVQKQTPPPAQKPKQKSTATTPVKTSSAKNGSAASPGHYLQIGAFTKTPNKEFLEKISKYNYRTQTSLINGQTITKYLIGPYQSRTDANRDVLKITTEIGKPVHIQIK